MSEQIEFRVKEVIEDPVADMKKRFPEESITFAQEIGDHFYVMTPYHTGVYVRGKEKLQ